MSDHGRILLRTGTGRSGPRLFLATIQWLDLVQAIFSFSESQLLSHLQNERFSETISRIAFSSNFL